MSFGAKKKGGASVTALVPAIKIRYNIKWRHRRRKSEGRRREGRQMQHGWGRIFRIKDSDDRREMKASQRSSEKQHGWIFRLCASRFDVEWKIVPRKVNTYSSPKTIANRSVRWHSPGVHVNLRWFAFCWWLGNRVIRVKISCHASWSKR